jgi:hypothetical protein
MPRIEVDTGQLTGAAADQADVATSLYDLSSRVSAVGADSGVLGLPQAQSALEAWAEHWSGSLTANAGSVGGLSLNLFTSASNYVTCDANAIP